MRSPRWKLRFAVPTAVMFVAGAALGAVWALLLGPVVSDSLVPGLAASLTNGGRARVRGGRPRDRPVLMLLPVAVAWLRRPDRSEALDGFTAGVASALGLTMAATLTELAPLLRAGNLIQGSSVLANLTEAVIRGISVPLVAAAATGYIAAVLWSRRGTGSAAGGRWFTHPIPALAVALVVEIGLGYADDAGPSRHCPADRPLAAAAAGLAGPADRPASRPAARSSGTCGSGRPGSARTAIGSCPRCRSAPCAAWPSARPRSTRFRSFAPQPPPPARPGSDPGSGSRNAARRRGRDSRGGLHRAACHRGAAQHAAAIPDGHWGVRPSRPPARPGHPAHRLGLATVLLVALPSPPAPTTPCTSLQCLGPFGVPAHLPQVYTSSEGWSVQWYPASAVFSQAAPHDLGLGLR